MKNFFNFKSLCSKKERTLGFIIRLFGLDFSILLTGYIDDMALVNLKALTKDLLGVYLQLVFIVIFVGRNSVIYDDNFQKTYS